MPIVALLAFLAIVALIFLPSWFVRQVMLTNAGERADIPGTGGELARHLLDRFDLGDITVETSDIGDHYDPEARVVRLLPQNFFGRSVTAVAVAAHEVGHAVQDARGEALFSWRTRLAKLAMAFNQIATVALIASPILGLVLRSPAALLMPVTLALALMAVSLIVHLVTLPVELDASFGKALPILAEGGYLAEHDLPAARAVLRAASFTYVAGALIGVLSFLRFLRMVRF